MKEEEILYYIGFSYFTGIGPLRFFHLKKKFKTVKEAYLADKYILRNILGEKITEKFIEFRKKFDFEKEYQKIRRKNIRVIVFDDKNYPFDLKKIADPPICIYARGSFDFSALHKLFSLAIVGTRKPTSYGREVTKKFSFELSKAGFIIISGLAYGIDTLAHQFCLEAGGKTIAVLGCGVDVVYPSSNNVLYKKIIQTGGAVISEFPPGHKVLKGLFVSRNRIISGLSKGVIVVEGSLKSGSLITARYAAEQGKEVFAPPSPINSKMGEAPNFIIKQGAKLMVSTEDILNEFNLKVAPTEEKQIKEKLSDKEMKIFDLLKEKPLSIEDLILRLNQPASDILKILSILEIKNLIKKNEENFYQINNFL